MAVIAIRNAVTIAVTPPAPAFQIPAAVPLHPARLVPAVPVAGALPVARYPHMAVAAQVPKSRYPHVTVTGRRSHFVAGRRRCHVEVNVDVPRVGRDGNR